MAFKRRVYLPAAQGVTPGDAGRITVPVGPLYDGIHLMLSNTDGDYAELIVDEVRCMINGVAQRTFSISELETINTMNGSEFANVAAGTALHGNPGYAEIVPIMFAEPFRKEVFYQQLRAWGTGDVGSFQIEMDITAASNAGAAVIAYAELSQSLVAVGKSTVQQPMGVIEKWYRHGVDIGGTTKNITDLPTVRGDYSQITFFDQYITKAKVLLNRTTVAELTKQQSDEILTRHGMTPVSTTFALIWDYDDIANNLLPMTQFQGVPVTDFQIDLELSDGTPRSIPTVLQIVGRPD